jgi:hypothetical protein
LVVEPSSVLVSGLVPELVLVLVLGSGGMKGLLNS